MASLLMAAGVYAVAIALIRSDYMAGAPGTLSLGVLVDLTITVPLILYFVGVRRGQLPRWLLVVALVAGLATASAILPPEQRGLLQVSALVWAAAELALAAFALYKLRQIVQSVSAHRKAGWSVRTALERALNEVLGQPLLASLLAQELSVLGYALVGWLVKPRRGANCFSYHRRNPWPATMIALIVILCAEAMGVHVLVRQWSPVAAMAVSMLHLYTLLWLLGDFQLMRHTPVYLGERELVIEIGFRRRARIALDNIVAIAPDIAPASDHVKALAMGEPNLIIELARSVAIDLPLGRETQAKTVALKLDDPDRFMTVWAERVAGTPGREDAVNPRAPNRPSGREVS